MYVWKAKKKGEHHDNYENLYKRMAAGHTKGD